MVEEMIQAFLERQGCGYVSYNAPEDAFSFLKKTTKRSTSRLSI
jgi:hypothetical protein